MVGGFQIVPLIETETGESDACDKHTHILKHNSAAEQRCCTVPSACCICGLIAAASVALMIGFFAYLRGGIPWCGDLCCLQKSVDEQFPVWQRNWQDELDIHPYPNVASIPYIASTFGYVAGNTSHPGYFTDLSALSWLSYWWEFAMEILVPFLRRSTTVHTQALAFLGYIDTSRCTKAVRGHILHESLTAQKSQVGPSGLEELFFKFQEETGACSSESDRPPFVQKIVVPDKLIVKDSLYSNLEITMPSKKWYRKDVPLAQHNLDWIKVTSTWSQSEGVTRHALVHHWVESFILAVKHSLSNSSHVLNRLAQAFTGQVTEVTRLNGPIVFVSHLPGLDFSGGMLTSFFPWFYDLNMQLSFDWTLRYNKCGRAMYNFHEIDQDHPFMVAPHMYDDASRLIDEFVDFDSEEMQGIDSQTITTFFHISGLKPPSDLEQRPSLRELLKIFVYSAVFHDTFHQFPYASLALDDTQGTPTSRTAYNQLDVGRFSCPLRSYPLKRLSITTRESSAVEAFYSSMEGTLNRVRSPYFPDNSMFNFTHWAHAVAS